MSKIGRYGNLYDRDGNLIRRCDEHGVLHSYSLEELDELCKTLTPGTLEYQNATSLLIEWYTHPRNKKDREYVQKKQAELLEQLQKQAEENKKKQPESVIQALNEVNAQLDEPIEDADFEEIKDENDGEEHETS